MKARLVSLHRAHDPFPREHTTSLEDLSHIGHVQTCKCGASIREGVTSTRGRYQMREGSRCEPQLYNECAKQHKIRTNEAEKSRGQLSTQRNDDHSPNEYINGNLETVAAYQTLLFAPLLRLIFFCCL